VYEINWEKHFNHTAGEHSILHFSFLQ